MKNYKILTNCLCCNNTELKLILDLGTQPLANSYCNKVEEKEEQFPLAINFCPVCTHVQLTHAVNPDLLFKNYLYVSGTTETLRKYFDWFVQYTESFFPGKKLTVLDIACNDGTQLNSYKNNGHQTYGIDPAENLFPLSSINHSIICDYFTKDATKKFNVKFNVIVAQNVFAHNSYPFEFLEIAADLLDTEGKIFIQTSQANIIEYGQFDTIYHEHISFFSTKSFATLSSRLGLFLQNVIKTDIHGTSYVFVLSKNPNDNNNERYMLDNEIEKVRIDSVMKKFADDAKATIIDLQNKILPFRQKKYPIIGYGAAAKGNTVLNFGEINLDYIVDDNPMKQGLFTPGRKIPIVSLDFINKKFPQTELVWLPLSWNFFNEIKNKITNTRKIQDHFIQLNFTKL